MARFRVCIVNGGSRKIPDIVAALSGLGCNCAVIPLPDANAHAVNDYAAAVLSGGPGLFSSKDDGPRLRAQFDFIARLAVPTLGICLGHQAIGIRFGAAIRKAELAHRLEPIRLLRPHPLIDGIADGTPFHEEHSENISLPPGFLHIATSDSCQIEAMACDERRLYGVQFHPEVSGEPGARLFANFLRLARHTARAANQESGSMKKQDCPAFAAILLLLRLGFMALLPCSITVFSLACQIGKTQAPGACPPTSIALAIVAGFCLAPFGLFGLFILLRGLKQ